MSDSLLEESIESLSYIVDNSPKDSDQFRYACFGLGKWIYRDQIRATLVGNLLQEHAENINTLVYSFRNGNTGWYSLSRIVREAKHPTVRYHAVRALSNGYLKGERVDIVWNIISDTSIPQDLRAVAIKMCGNYFINRSNDKRKQIENWSKGSGIFAKTTGEVLEGDEAVIERLRASLKQKKAERSKDGVKAW